MRDSRPPRVGACAVLVRDDRILLGHRSAERPYYPDVWDLIGGHTERGERPEDTLVREMHEEIGCVPTRFEKVGIFPEPNPEAHGPGEFHVFAVRAWRGPEPRALNHEHDELGWFTLDELRDLRLADRSYVGLIERILR